MELIPSPRIRRSPYHAATVAAGATHWTVYNKMLMPLSYGDLDAEYRRLTTGVAMWDVAAERQVQVTGPDAGACVQYLTSRDLGAMVVGQGKYVAVCDHAGRLLNDPVLLKLADDRYWFSLADSDLLLWCRAVAAEKGFEVIVSEPDVSPLAIQGPAAEDVVADLFGDGVRTLKYFWSVETSLEGIPLVVCRSGWSKQGGYELFLGDGTRGSDLWNLVAAAGEPFGIGPGAPNHVERVESGLLSWGGDTTPDSNPFEAMLARYVDVDTEVEYVGKAALQRIAAEGPARQLVGLLVADEPEDRWMLVERRSVWLGERPVGTVSAVVRSPRLGRTIGMAQIASDVVSSGAAVEIDSPAGRRTAEITSLPFVR